MVYDATHNRGDYADVIYQDSSRITVVFPNGARRPLVWDDCPEYNASGDLTGKRLPPYECRGVNGPSAHDSDGCQWLIGKD
jgi:hypothetical protein